MNKILGSVAPAYFVRMLSVGKKCIRAGFFFLLILVSFGFLLSRLVIDANANSYNTSIYDLKYLKGIETLAIDFSTSADYTLMHDYLAPPLAKPGANVGETLVDALKEVFRNETRITPELYQFITSKGDLDNATSIITHFRLATQAEDFKGQRLRVANLSVRYFYTGKDNIQVEMKMPIASYPFIVPDTHDKFLKKIKEAAIYLTFYLPKYYACANEGDEREMRSCLSLDDYEPWLNRK